MGFLGSMLGTQNKFTAEKAKTDKSNYGTGITQAQQGALDNSKFNQVFGQQQNLNQQYGDVAAGKGPNPALAMLRQQTGQNVNMAQGQAASQRGVNPALAARMAVDSGATANQGTAGQAATLQAQQSLAALGQQGGLLGQMQQGANTQQALQGNVLGTLGGLQNQQNNTEVANQQGANQINAGVAAQNTDINAQLAGGLLNAAGGVASMGMMPKMAAHGGLISADEQPEMAGLEEPSPLHGYLESLERLSQPAPAPTGPMPGYSAGGDVAPFWSEPPSPDVAPAMPVPGPGESFQPMGPGAAPVPPAKPQAQQPLPAKPFEMRSSMGAFDRFAGMPRPAGMAGGGPVPFDFQSGGHVPGQPQVAGDSEKNDIVPALLSPGEAVIPRTVMQAPNPPAEAAAFVEHLLRRKGQTGSFEKAFKGRKMADGGKVETPDAPKLTDALSGWWGARGTPGEEQHARNVDEAVNALLPSLVSGRKALQKKRADLKKVDESTGN